MLFGVIAVAAPAPPDLAQEAALTNWDDPDPALTTDATYLDGNLATRAGRLSRGAEDMVKLTWNTGFPPIPGDTVTAHIVKLRGAGDCRLAPYNSATTIDNVNVVDVTPCTPPGGPGNSCPTTYTLTAAFIGALADLGGGSFAMRFVCISATNVLVDRAEVTEFEADITPGCILDTDCDDGNECTTDVCVVGICQNNAVIDGTACTDDGLVCSDDVCQTGVCAHPPTAAATECRASTDECDPAEVCDGVALTCPTDAFLPDLTACTDDGLLCSDDVCQTGVCSHPPTAAATECRASTDECDPAEVCNGVALTCPTDAFLPDSTACTDDGLLCSDDVCQAGVCSHPALPLNTLCRASTDECDPQEVCNGVALTCPTDSFLPDLTACTDDGLLCSDDVCQAGACSHPPLAAATECRASTDECDPAEVCNGVALTCPTDSFLPDLTTCSDDGLSCSDDVCQTGVCSHPPTAAATECRASTDECDPAEVCDGVALTCPTDSFLPDLATCTDDGLLCSDDVCQTGVCSHPAKAAATECRASTDECDPAEVCNGVALTCPTDSFLPDLTTCTDDGLLCSDDVCQAGVCSHPPVPLNTLCRASTDECDPQEVCDGVALSCPLDSFLPDLTACTDDGLLCSDDVCQTGVCSHPPTAAATECRASTDECDPAEVCNGVALTCPTDAFLPDLTTCSDDGLLCSDDVCQAGVCSHPALALNTLCRASTDECDPQEVCDGVALSCPLDSFLPDLTVCTDDGLLCSDDVCQAGVCSHPPVPLNTLCRASTDECDPQEVCDGVALSCPLDSFLPELTVCTDDGLLCSDDVCQSGVCSHPAVPLNTLCRASTDECDPQEVCDGVALTCPTDSFTPDLTTCTDDGLPCSDDVCQSGVCSHPATLVGTLCRTSTDECDPQEVCNGVALTCPTDSFLGDGTACTDDGLLCSDDVCQSGACTHPPRPLDTECRASTDECDPAEVCDGASLTCPTDTLATDGTTCTDDGLPCSDDVCQTGVCAHPPTALGTECRASTDECDPAEVCDGAALTCPTEVFLPNGTVCTDDGALCSDDVCQTGVCLHPAKIDGTLCRASTDECDPQEVCDGISITCPIDGFVPNGTVCTDDGLLCSDDVCQGGACSHPPTTGGTLCRASTDECDPQEVCDGAALTCPTDSFLPDLTACTDDGLVCSDDVCQSGVCSHPVTPGGTLCRASTDECDPQEVCDGLVLTCPTDSFLPDLTACTDDGLLCSDDVCQTGVCSHPALPLNTLCRASTDECDPQEVCDGVSIVCPIDGFLPNGTVCTDDGLLCSDDVCQAGLCDHPPTLSGTLCRASTDECDPQEVCDGLVLTCPTDLFLPDLTACTDDGLLCSDDVCQTGVCSHPPELLGTLCRASTDECDPQEECNGVALTCPTDSFLPDLTTCIDDGLLCSDDICLTGLCSHPPLLVNTLCRASTDECDPQEVCDGVALACPLDSFLPDATVCTDDGLLCSDDICQTGLCSHPPLLVNTLCRASTDECDPQEVCDGVALTCPLDSFLPDLTTCTDDGLLCSDDICQTGLCSHPPLLLNTLCRASTDECDPQEVCDGVALACPLDSFLPDATVCTDDGLLCSDDICQTGLCSHPPLLFNTLCRASTDECDPQEVCDGVALACPLDSFLADATVCTDDGFVCSDDICLTGLCSHPPLPLNTLCRASTDQCDPQEVCDGVAVACPGDLFLPDTTPCDDGASCNVGEACLTGVCVGGGLPDCVPASDDCNTATCDTLGLEGNCDIITPQPNGTLCDDGLPCTTDACDAGLCLGSPNAQITVDIDIGGLGKAVMRDVTFTVTTCGGLVDARVISVVFDIFGSATVVLDNVEDTATWLAVREGHTLRALVPLSFVSCATMVNLTGAGALLSGDFQTAVIVQDNLVDISDFSILATAFNTPVSPDSSLGADATGDGVQGTADFAAIQANFLALGDLFDGCPGGTSLSGGRSGGLTRFGGTADVFGAVPRSSIPVDELGFVGAELADLNNDGVIDTHDIRAFAARHGFRLSPAFEQQLGSLESVKRRRTRR